MEQNGHPAVGSGTINDVCKYAAAQDGNPLLWEVTSRSTTVYLLGTNHVGSRAMYPPPRPTPGLPRAHRRAAP